MEMFDLYDNSGILLNKVAQRGSALNEGEFHLVVHVWIKNSNGQYLIQKRSKKTDIVFGMWASTSGAATTGDTSINAAIRETFEEIGILLSESELKLLKRYYIGHEKASYIADVYIVNRDILLKDLKLDKFEVSECDFKTIKEINEMIENKDFFDYATFLKKYDYMELLEKS